VRLGQLAVLLEVDEGDGGDPGALVDGAVLEVVLVLGDGVELVPELTFMTVREFQRPR
jgi:hypothetical protein